MVEILAPAEGPSKRTSESTLSLLIYTEGYCLSGEAIRKLDGYTSKEVLRTQFEANVIYDRQISVGRRFEVCSTPAGAYQGM